MVLAKCLCYTCIDSEMFLFSLDISFVLVIDYTEYILS